MKQIWRLGITSVLLLVSSLGFANSDDKPQLLGFEHKNLRSGQVTDLKQLKGKPVAIMFFEPECSWCIKQARVLNQLQEQCNQSFTPVMLGVHGNFVALKRALFDLGVKLPAYRASKSLVKAMGGIPATPIMLVTDEQGRYRKYYRGLTKETKLKPLLCEPQTATIASL